MRTVYHYVNGETFEGTSGNTQPVLNPSTGKEQAAVALANKADVDSVIAESAKAQPGWAALNPQKRIRIIMEWIRLIHENMDELATQLSLEHGKTFPDAKGDVLRGVDVLEFALGAPHQLRVSILRRLAPVSIPTRCASHLVWSPVLPRSISRP